MKHTIIIITTALLTGCASFATYESPLERAIIEARNTYNDEMSITRAGRNNCLTVARAAQASLAERGIDSEIVIIDRVRDPMPHAVLCVENLCGDNGHLSDPMFDRSELERG